MLEIRCSKKQDTTEVEDARILRSIAEGLVNQGTTGQDVADAVIACLEYKNAKKLEFTNEQFFEAFYMFRWYEMLHFAEWKLTLDDFVEFQSGACNLMKVEIDSVPFRVLYIQALRNLYRDHGGASLPYDNFKNVFKKCIDLIHKEQSFGTLEDHCMKDSAIIRGVDEFVEKTNSCT